MGVEANGVWNSEEIQPITANKYLIERVVNRRGNAKGKQEQFVKLLRWPDKFNSWVEEALFTMSVLNEDEMLITLHCVPTQGSAAANRTSRYETRLAQSIRLDGVSVAALVNFTYPHK